MDRLKELSPGAWAALCTIMLSGALIIIFAPAHFWASLGAADWKHVAGVIGLVGSAIVGVFTRGTAPKEIDASVLSDAHTPPRTPAAIARARQWPPAPPAGPGPRSREEGFARPSLMFALSAMGILPLVIVALVALSIAGCGASPTRIHATTATVFTATGQTARQLLLEAVDQRIAACRARPAEEIRPCLDTTQRADTDAGIAIDSALLAIGLYREAIEVSQLADDPDAVEQALTRAKRFAIERWAHAAELARAVGADIGTNPGGAQ